MRGQGRPVLSTVAPRTICILFFVPFTERPRVKKRTAAGRAHHEDLHARCGQPTHGDFCGCRRDCLARCE